MFRSPVERRPSDPWKAAEAAFKMAATKSIEGSESSSGPGMRIDRGGSNMSGRTARDGRTASMRRYGKAAGKSRDCLMNAGTPVSARAVLAALLLVSAPAAIAQDLQPVHYTCADGTRLQATFSPPSSASGSVKLVFAGSSTQTILPQAVSADGGRYTQGDVEFWIKGQGATLARAGKSTTCQVGR